MFLDEENRNSYVPKWKKVLGCMSIFLAYLFLAGGITLACLVQIPSALRIIAPIAGIFCYVLCGTMGYFSTVVGFSYNSNSIQKKREWKEASKWMRFLYITTFPCMLIVKVFYY